MGVKLTEKQLEAVKSIVEFAEVFADEILKAMKNHGLSAKDGCSLSINIDPDFLFATESIRFGNRYRIGDVGFIELTKGRRSANEKFVPTGGNNSPEYEWLFADEAVRSRMEKIVHPEKPLPPDGLWISDNRNDPPVDGWEWDVNDSLS